MEEKITSKDSRSLPVWLGSRLYSLTQLEPTLQMDGRYSVLIRAGAREHRPAYRMLSGLAVEQGDDVYTIFHEWHNTRSTSATGYRHCGRVMYTLKGEQLLGMQTSDEQHGHVEPFAATVEAGSLMQMRQRLFDPSITIRAAHNAAEVLHQHHFETPMIVTALGRIGLKVPVGT